MVKLWDKKTNLYLPNGKEYTPDQIFEEFGFPKFAPTVITIVGHTTMAIDNLDILVNNYGIDEGLTAEDALVAVLAAQEEANKPQPVLDEMVFVAALKAAFPQQAVDETAVINAVKAAKFETTENRR